MDYFFFGTLRDGDMREIVIGRRLDADELAPASLAGYRLVHVAGEPYPTLAAGDGASVDGVVARGLTPGELERIAWFEGMEYVPRPFLVTHPDGTTATALAHGPTTAVEASDEPWDFAAWQRDDKPLTVALTRLHMDLFGRVPLEEAVAAWDDIHARLGRIFSGRANPPDDD